MIGLQRRFDQNFMRVRQAVQKKEVGEPIMIKLCSRDPSPPPFSYVKVDILFVCFVVIIVDASGLTYLSQFSSVRVVAVFSPIWRYMI